MKTTNFTSAEHGPVTTIAAAEADRLERYLPGIAVELARQKTM
jgi:hypothetical protein